MNKIKTEEVKEEEKNEENKYTENEIGFKNLKSTTWLIKIPNFLHEHWESLEKTENLGELKIDKKVSLVSKVGEFDFVNSYK
jgi:hypothetical protein